MKLKQKRGWLKLGLTAAMVLTFMFALSVTAMANEVASITLVPVPVDNADIGIEFHVAIPDGGGLVDLVLQMGWDGNILVPVATPDHTFTPAFMHPVLPMRLTALEPLIPHPETGYDLITIAFDPTGPMVNAPPPMPNMTDSGLLGTMRFDFVEGVNEAAPASIPITLTVQTVGSMVEGVRVLPPVVTASATGYTIQVGHIVWNFYGLVDAAGNVDTAAQAFVTAVMPGGPHAAWFHRLYHEVWQGALGGVGTIQEAHAAAVYWEENPVTPD